VGGIAGIVHFRGDPPSRELAKQLSSAIAQRGRDDKGVFYGPPIAMVQRRFRSEADTGKRPHIGDRYAMLLDGPGDLTQVAKTWPEQGIAALSDIGVGFSIAIWDRREHVLWLARDPVGSRPLYWAQDTQKFAFSSVIRPLLNLDFVSRELAVDQLAEYLSFRYVHAPRTLLRDIAQVPPGHIARVDSSGVRVDRWWTPKWSAVGAPTTDMNVATDRIDAAIQRATERSLRADVPTGVLLSGGLNSTIALFHALRANTQDPIAYTASLDGDPADESAFAARIAGVLKADHRIITIDNTSLIDAIDPVTEAMGHPLPSPAGLAQHLLCQAICSDVRVLLSGTGGDEVLAGRGMPLLAERLRRTRMVGRLPAPTRKIGRRIAQAAGLKDLAIAQIDFGLSRKIGGSRVFDAAERVQLLRDPAMARPGVRHSLLEPMYQEVVSDPINEILHVWQRGWLCEDLLAREDRIAAFHGVEMRHPLVNISLLELAAGIPGPDKLKRSGLGYQGKAHLRRALYDRVPQQLIDRPNRSMPSPMGEWLRGFGAKMVRDRIDALCDDPSALFAPKALRRIARDHHDGKADHGVKLWTLILLGAWLKNR
jgi:asparagine synthase (glutamine-hydrolysing)